MVPVWAVSDGLTSVLLGAFMLILVGVINIRLELSPKLGNEVKQREAKTQRRKTPEQTLVGPLAVGRVTFANRCIDVSSNVLSAVNSDQLQPGGRVLMKSLARPPIVYLTPCEEILMVSGFSDDQQVYVGNQLFIDNWEPPAKCTLAATRVLIDEGILASNVFAVASESQQPANSNTDDIGRAKNWHVEIAPAPGQAASDGGRREPH